MEHSAAYQQGYDAYTGPIKGKLNPYPPDTQESSDWYDGFDAADSDWAW